MRLIIWIIGIVTVAVALTIPFSWIIGYGLDLDWSGVNKSIISKHSNQDIRREKTLWDWMQLLIVPAVLAGGGILFNWAQNQRNQQLEEERKNNDQRLEDERKNNELKIAARRAQDEALSAYLDHMGQILLTKSSRARQLSRDAATVARARTLTVLGELGGEDEPEGKRNKHKRSVLQFLYEADLIKGESPVIDLSRADLSYADLSATLLVGATGDDQSGGDDSTEGGFILREANLRETILIGADLSSADLTNADLSGAALVATDLRYANLSNAHLSGAIMANTFVRNANFSSADLTGAKLVNTDELERTALSLEGATMPNGRKYGHGSRNLPIMLACLVVAFLLSRGAHRRRADN